MRRHFGWFSGVALGVNVVLRSAAALAQAAAPAPASAPTAIAPDVIVMNDGSRYRGTIAELVKDGPITIVLITGETRKLTSDEVAYAGPATNEPVATAAPVVSAEAGAAAEATEEEESEGPENKLVRVRFSANRVGSELFVRQSATKFRKICTAPCAHDFEPAVYSIGVRFDKNAKVKSLQDVMLDEPSTLTVDYRSRASLRGVGGALLAIGGSLGAVCAIYLLAEERPNNALGYLGATTGLAGAIVGISFMMVGDKVILTVK